MIALADVIDRFAGDHRRRYGHTLTPERAQALSAMQHCRRRMAPQLLVACPDCAEQRLIPHSCGHRLCPHCQHFESERWLERQRRLQVPAEYFLLTFTLPGELRPLAFRHAEAVYAALFASAWATVQSFCLKGLIALLHLVLRITPLSAPPTEKPRPAFLCPCCGKPMQVIRRRIVPTGVRRRDTAAATETAV